MPTAGELYTSFVAAMNARDWATAESLLAPSPTVNGQPLSSAFLITQISGLSGLGPDLVSTIDLIHETQAGDAAFTRVIHRLTLSQDAFGAKATGKPVEFAEHSLFKVEDGKVAVINTMMDFEALREGAEEQIRWAPKLVQPAPAPEGFDLQATYDAYVASLNDRTFNQKYLEFTNDTLTHNTNDLTADQFRGFLEEATKIIEGQKYHVAETIVDNEKQRIAARIVISGTPAKEFRGMKPTGKSVEFPENALYQFDGGKIKQITALLDLDAYRKGLEA